jgi:hypothetical protein
MRKRTDSYAAVLDDLLRLGRQLLARIEREKFVRGPKLWACALFTKILSSGHSVRLLIREGATLDAKMLLRSMLDALLDILYIVEDPLKEEMLVELYLVEHIEDWYRRLRDFAIFHDATVEQIARELPVAERIVSERGEAKRRQRSGIMKARYARAGLPTRWRDIDWRRKRKAVGGLERLPELLHFGIRLLGDAAAHCRPIALQQYLVSEPDGQVAFRLKPRPDHYWSRKRLAFEACVCLAPAIDKMTDVYYFQNEFQESLQNIVERLDRLKPKKSSGGAARHVTRDR